MKKDDPNFYDHQNYDPNMRLSCPSFYETDLKQIWKKERNRLAAKKSRDKKAIHLRHLENKEKIMERQLVDLKEAIVDYDNILNRLLCFLDKNLNVVDLIGLFDTLCGLKKPNGGEYFKEVNFIESGLIVGNERIEEMVIRIRNCLNEMVYKYS